MEEKGQILAHTSVEMRKRERRLILNRLLHGIFVSLFAITTTTFALMFLVALASLPELIGEGQYYCFTAAVLAFGTCGAAIGPKIIDPRWIELSSRIDKWGLSEITRDTQNITVITALITFVTYTMPAVTKMHWLREAIECVMCVSSAITAGLAAIFFIVYKIWTRQK